MTLLVAAGEVQQQGCCPLQGLVEAGCPPPHVEAAWPRALSPLCGSDHSMEAACHPHGDTACMALALPPGGLGGSVVYWAEDGLSSHPSGKCCVQTPPCMQLKLP